MCVCVCVFGVCLQEQMYTRNSDVISSDLQFVVDRTTSSDWRNHGNMQVGGVQLGRGVVVKRRSVGEAVGVCVVLCVDKV